MSVDTWPEPVGTWGVRPGSDKCFEIIFRLGSITFTLAGLSTNPNPVITEAWVEFRKKQRNACQANFLSGSVRLGQKIAPKAELQLCCETLFKLKTWSPEEFSSLQFQQLVTWCCSDARRRSVVFIQCQSCNCGAGSLVSEVMKRDSFVKRKCEAC